MERLRPTPALPTAPRRQLSHFLRALATYDCFPDFSAKLRRLLYNPLGVLVLGALAALVCGLFVHRQGLFLCGGMLAVILLGVSWPWLCLRGLSGTMAFDRLRASEGEAVEARLTLGNRWPWPAWGLTVRGGFDASGAATEPVVSLAAAPGRRGVLCRWEFRPACRGAYPLLVPQLGTGFPFGLWEKRRPLTVTAPLLVWPRTFPVGPAPLLAGERQVEGSVSRTKVGLSGDVLGVRPYRRGDSPRRIHWAQTARHDRLIVCELQSNARPVIQLVLDDDPRVHAGRGADGSREWAIRIVASLVRGWLGEGALLEAVWHGQTFRASSGTAHLHRLLDSLALLPDAPGPALTEVLAGAACRDFSEGLQVVVTTDLSLERLTGMPGRQGPGQRRWAVLRAGGFGEAESSADTILPRFVRPWLWFDSAGCVPGLLRGGWKEARHGS